MAALIICRVGATLKPPDVKQEQSHYRPGQTQRLPEVEVPRFQDNRHIKVVKLSALRTGRLYPPGNIPGTHFCYRLSQPQGHIAAGRIMSMKKSNDTIGNQTGDLPTRSAVPQPTAPTRAPNVLPSCSGLKMETQ